MKTHIILSITFIFFPLVIYSLNSQEQIADLPTFYITTQDGLPVTEKKVWKTAHLSVKSSVPTEALDIVTEIRGRGNSTWGMPKKPYRIKLNSKQNLLNLPAREKNWVLLANYADKSLIRNALAFKVSELVELGFTPSVRFVDVVFNGSFDGNYMLTDHIEVNNFRVPVEKQLMTDTDESRISGGYLLEIDGFADWDPPEPEFFYSEKDRAVKFTIKYPRHDEINDVQREYIKDYIRDFENRLFGPDFKDSSLGYRAKTDTLSLINWYIACELTGNSDSFWSTYIYKRRNDDKLYFGPLWDYDIAFNNDRRLDDAADKLMREHAHSPRNWIERFWQDEWFRGAVSRRWNELIEKEILPQLLNYLTETAQLIDESQQLNYERWNTLNIRVYQETYLFDTYEEGIDFLNSYLIKRVNFLTDQFADTDLLPSEPFLPEEFAYYMIMNKKTKNVIQVENNSVYQEAALCMWSPVSTNDSQLWQIIPLDNEYFNIINKHSGLAITGKGFERNLIQSYLDENNDAQKWRITPVGSGNIYGLENKSSGYSINNSAGGNANGNPVIEYTNNIHLSEKVNQHWQFVKTEQEIINNIFPDIREDYMTIYPNPAKEYAYVKLNQAIVGDYELSVYGISGKKLYSGKFNSGNHTISVPVYNFEPGIYFVILQTNSGQNLKQKLVVK